MARKPRTPHKPERKQAGPVTLFDIIRDPDLFRGFLIFSALFLTKPRDAAAVLRRLWFFPFVDLPTGEVYWRQKKTIKSDFRAMTKALKTASKMKVKK